MITDLIHVAWGPLTSPGCRRARHRMSQQMRQLEAPEASQTGWPDPACSGTTLSIKPKSVNKQAQASAFQIAEDYHSHAGPGIVCMQDNTCVAGCAAALSACGMSLSLLRQPMRFRPDPRSRSLIQSSVFNLSTTRRSSQGTQHSLNSAS